MTMSKNQKKPKKRPLKKKKLQSRHQKRHHLRKLQKPHQRKKHQRKRHPGNRPPGKRKRLPQRRRRKRKPVKKHPKSRLPKSRHPRNRLKRRPANRHPGKKADHQRIQKSKKKDSAGRLNPFFNFFLKFIEMSFIYDTQQGIQSPDGFFYLCSGQKLFIQSFFKLIKVNDLYKSIRKNYNISKQIPEYIFIAFVIIRIVYYIAIPIDKAVIIKQEFTDLVVFFQKIT